LLISWVRGGDKTEQHEQLRLARAGAVSIGSRQGGTPHPRLLRVPGTFGKLVVKAEAVLINVTAVFEAAEGN
jgi:hypothetical protein